MRKKHLLFVLFGLFAVQATTQSVFGDIAETTISSMSERSTTLRNFRTVRLDAAALQAILLAAPERFRSNAPRPVLEFPLPDGSLAAFDLVESSVMAPALQQRYPEIRSYSGRCAEDPAAVLKCNWTPYGFHAMLISARWGTVYMDPYRLGDTEHYVVYNKKDYLPEAKKQVFGCGTEASDLDETWPEIPSASVSARSNDGFMRQYRLALACTGEYATFHGGQKPLVLAAMVVSVNRINSVYEQEFAVTLQLVPNNDTLIFLDPDTDPYTNNNGGAMMGQNRTVCNDLIGFENYDIGHVFSTGGGGIASLGSVCTNIKAQGVTGQNAPIGDPFDIDYVAHEIGHQFAGNHTQNNNCSRNGATAMEPGSGSTIMGYAGICAPNVQNNSHDYFHGVNVAEVMQFILEEEGSTCPQLIPTDNKAPMLSPLTNYSIPKSTPFVLRATAQDADAADILTYCWEQMDNQTATMPPNSNSATGPLFRSFPPETVPDRYFPQLATLVPGANSTWEKLPAVSRTLRFRVTVRDNSPGGGSTAQGNMTVTVNGNAGPFVVTHPNVATIWQTGEYRIITWDVADTDKPPVACAAVNIRLSTDGGYTYPVTLATGVPNTGSYCISVPDVQTDKARILVEAANNIFFDISNSNFQIVPPQAPAFSLCVEQPVAQVCLPQTFSTSITTSALLGASSPISLAMSGLPIGSTALFSPNPVQPGQTAQMGIAFPSNVPEGVLAVEVIGFSGTDTIRIPLTLMVVSNNFDNLLLLSPTNGANGIDQAPVLRWQAVPDANTYDVQLSESPAFDVTLFAPENIVVDTLKTPILLEKGKIYYWRVRPKNECGLGNWVGPYAFSSIVDVCAAFEAFDLPKNIPTSISTIESKINVPANATISDVNVRKIQGNHSFFRDLELRLVSPSGTNVLLLFQKCGGFNGNFNFGFDDSSPNTTFACPPSNTGAFFRPEQLLNAFNGQSANGEWTLQVKDNFVSSGGSIAAFELELCSSSSLNPPILVNNNTLVIDPGTNKVVTTDLLKTEDGNNTDQQLIYTLMSKPQHGMLQLYWTGEMPVGAQFSQADLNNGGLRYFHYGTNADTDHFCFTVTDGEGGLIYDCFTVQPLPLSAREARTLDFLLAPNPATETVRLAFGEALRSNAHVRLFDAAGRLVQTQVLAAGQTTLVLQVAQLPEGLYTLAVDNAEGSGVRKLVVR